MFRTMKLRSKKKECAICGDHPTITQLIDYVAFCGAGADDKVTLLKICVPLSVKLANVDLFA